MDFEWQRNHKLFLAGLKYEWLNVYLKCQVQEGFERKKAVDQILFLVFMGYSGKQAAGFMVCFACSCIERLDYYLKTI